MNVKNSMEQQDFGQKRLLKRSFAGFLIITIVCLDFFSKQWALYGLNLQDYSHIEVSRFFNFTLVWNRGVSFGFLSVDTDWVRYALIVFVSIITLILAVWLWRTRNDWLRLALSLIIGGAIGNTLDRIRFGAVVDFLDFSGLYFPWVFNFADCVISMGSFILFLILILDPKSEKGESPQEVEQKLLPESGKKQAR